MTGSRHERPYEGVRPDIETLGLKGVVEGQQADKKRG